MKLREVDLPVFANKIKGLIEKDLDKSAVFICLTGPLGAGKTRLVKEIAKTFGVQDVVVSPTYVINIPYQIGAQLENYKPRYLQHIDAWRLGSATEFEKLGIDRMISNQDLIIVEWADVIKDVFSTSYNLVPAYWIDISYSEDDLVRRIQIHKP